MEDPPNPPIDNGGDTVHGFMIFLACGGARIPEILFEGKIPTSPFSRGAPQELSRLDPQQELKQAAREVTKGKGIVKEHDGNIRLNEGT